jgi:hypothetical protein
MRYLLALLILAGCSKNNCNEYYVEFDNSESQFLYLYKNTIQIASIPPHQTRIVKFDKPESFTLNFIYHGRKEGGYPFSVTECDTVYHWVDHRK